MKRAAYDTALAVIKGKYKAPSSGTAGAAVDVCDGYLEFLSKAITDTKLTPVKTGNITEENIIDQVEALYQSIPEDRRSGDLLLGEDGTYFGSAFYTLPGDDPAAVAYNLRLLAARLGIEPGAVVMPHQTHGTEVRLICIGVSTADCLPVLLYDAEHRACCAVHAGWRGTAARIAQRAVAAMAAAFGTRPAALTAAIGPGISAAAFEVGDEVYEAFASAGFRMDSIAQRREKWHIDLAECNRLQLVEAGVGAGSVLVSGLCTYSHADELFSARRLGAFLSLTAQDSTRAMMDSTTPNTIAKRNPSRNTSPLRPARSCPEEPEPRPNRPANSAVPAAQPK